MWHLWVHPERMKNTQKTPILSSLVRGVVAGLAGTAVMTAFQKAVEMPVTDRGESYAPARFAEKVLPVGADSPQGRRRLNYAAHFGIGTLWGAAFAVAGRMGIHGQKAVHVVFPAVFSGDVLMNTALDLYEPSSWSTRDWVIDLLDKYVQAQATSAVYDRIAAQP